MVLKPQRIVLEKKENWTGEDLEIVKIAFPYAEQIEDCIELWKSNSMIRIADTKDYVYAYEDYLEDEEVEISFDEFVTELKKGYGKSKYIPIARLFELSNGIWYDNEFCQ